MTPIQHPARAGSGGIADMKIRQIWNSRNSIIKLLNSDLNVNISWRLKPLANQLQEIMQIHADLVKKYGQKNRELIEVPQSSEKDFMKEFEALLEEDLEISIKQIHLDELDGIKLSVFDLMNLEWLIIETK